VLVLHGCCWSTAWMSMPKTNTSGPHYIRQLSEEGLRSYGYFSSMVRTRTWRPSGGETALHLVSRGEYDSQEQGVSHCTAITGARCGRERTAERRLDLATLRQLSKGGPRSHGPFSTMARTRPRRPMGAKRRCTLCHEANTTPKNKVSALHGCYWSTVWT
jgi:hypothetical protein